MSIVLTQINGNNLYIFDDQHFQRMCFQSVLKRMTFFKVNVSVFLIQIEGNSFSGGKQSKLFKSICQN